MSQDYTNSKPPVGSVWPTGTVDTPYQQLEPLLTPAKLRTRHLFGIPLVSRIKDPITNKPMVMTDDILKDYIDRAINEVEIETSVDIMPRKNREKDAFDRALYESFGYMKTMRRPVWSIERLTVTPSNNVDVYEIPLDWVETAYLPKGQINIIPLTIAITSGAVVPASAAGGAVFLSIFGHKPWLPAFWQIDYSSGFPDGVLPQMLNEYIGVVAAINVLSSLAATWAQQTSTSLGIDGLSQSVGTPGPQLYKVRIDELKEQRKMLKGKIKAWAGQKIFSSNV